MVYPPEIYDGAQFTLIYDQCQQRIPVYYSYEDENNNNVDLPFGFAAALKIAVDDGIIDPSKYPLMFTNIDWIIKRLELKDCFKELSAETPDAWNMLCMRRWSEVLDKYEPILKMEAGVDVSNPDRDSRTIEYGHIIDGQVQDTPYGQLDASSDYVSGKTAEQHSGKDIITERTELDADILSRFRQKWDATINVLVDEFDNLFIRITGGDFIA